MDNASRVVINTIAQYTRMVINICLTLYSTRLVLSALGVNDYGIYTLIAGTVSLLSFIVNAMVVTTQRYMSFFYGRGEREKLKEILCNSIFIHFLFGVIIATLIEVVGLFLFDGFFNIATERLSVAHSVYHGVTLMLVITFLSAPFRALLIAHENIVYISAIDVIDGVLKLLVAIFILNAEGDKLIIYTIFLCLIQIFNLLAFSLYDFLKYEECIMPQIRYIRLRYISEISSFAGWTIFSTGCVVGRTQGFSIILNKFFSVSVNAAFGIALQVNGAVHQLSSALMNAMNPQIVKSEGSGNRGKMIRLSEIESKLCFLLICFAAVPCIVEMPQLLSFWLKETPEHAVFFCRCVLVASIMDQLTIGLTTANQAIGDIKLYSLVVNPIKILSLVPIIISLYFGGSLLYCMFFYVFFEFLCAIARFALLRFTAKISIRGFIRRVFLPELIPFLSILFCSVFLRYIFNFQYSFIINIVLSIFIGCYVSYIFGLCSDEKNIVNGIISKYSKK